MGVCGVGSTVADVIITVQDERSCPSSLGCNWLIFFTSRMAKPELLELHDQSNPRPL